jgi:hypothetical protein
MMQGYPVVTGTGEAAQGGADVTVIAAQGAGKVLRLMKAVVAVSVVASVAGGEVALEDGVNGTRFFEADADALGVYVLDFGDDGYPLTANTLLNITVDGSGGNQATARCTAICKVVG